MTFVGLPIDSVGRSGGTELAPAALRELGMPAVLGGEDAGDLDVSIRGDERDPETGILASDDVMATTRTVRATIAQLIASGKRPLLGGGCCAGLPGALAGARDALGHIALVNLDGHMDLFDGQTSPTGEAADMPVSVALGLGPARWVEEAGGPSLTLADTTLLGFRDKEEYDIVQPERLGPELVRVPLTQIRAQGAAAVGERAKTPRTDAGFWLHFDVDVLDEQVFPATDYLMPDGMTWEELLSVLAPLANSLSLVGMSLACYNPEKDPELAYGRKLVDVFAAVTQRNEP
jgi:arginase